MMAETRGAKVEVTCKQCGCKFTARLADKKRGWAKFCSKSCKAKEQEKRTGQYSDFLHSTKYKEPGLSSLCDGYDDGGDSEYWDGKDF